MGISPKIWITSVATVSVVMLGLTVPALAAGGDLDVTFGRDGKVSTYVAPGPSEANAVAIQQDGKIVAVGSNDLFEGDQTKFAVVRYNVDGTLDTSFGGDGIVTTDLTKHDDHAFGVAIQPDGKIVVVGYSGAGGKSLSKIKLTVVRYDVDGTLDPTFAGDGTVRTSVGPCDDYGAAVAIQSDGKIVVGGSAFLGGNCDNGAFAVARYDSDGALDSTFGSGGTVTNDLTPKSDFSWGVAIQTDGGLVEAGVAGLGGQNATFAVTRYLSDGSLDSTFGGDGSVSTDFTPDTDWAWENCVALQADGKILVSGTVGLGGPNSMFGVARYNTDGTLDTTFGGDGTVTTDFGQTGDENRASVAIQANGKIVLAGTSGFTGGGSHGRFALARYNPDGSLDTTFGGDGKVTTDFTRYDDSAAALAIAPDGAIVAAGVSGIGGLHAKLAVARYVAS